MKGAYLGLTAWGLILFIMPTVMIYKLYMALGAFLFLVIFIGIGVGLDFWWYERQMKKGWMKDD